MILLAMLLAIPALAAKDCHPITCELTQAGSSLAALTLRQEKNDDDKCSIFQSHSEITLANGNDKVTFSGAEQDSSVVLTLDFSLTEGQDLLGYASMRTTRAQLALAPVQLEVSYFTKDGKEAGSMELSCHRAGSH